MCDFFSFVTNSRGRQYFFDWPQRQAILKNKLASKRGQTITEADSHSQICDYYDLDCDKVNKYEYNPLTKVFTVDQINTKDRSIIEERWVREINFKAIVEPLIIKEIINPFEIKWKRETKKDIENLKKWSSVWVSACNSVRDSVRDSVGASACKSVWASVGYSVGYSVRDSVGYSVRDSVWAYISSFFDIKKWKHIKHKPGENPFQSCIDLWHRGFVPSFDGKTWRLHTSKGIVFEISNTKLLKDKTVVMEDKQGNKKEVYKDLFLRHFTPSSHNSN